MPTFLLQQLIDKQDNFEVVRNQIAGLLVSERDNQKALAVDAGKDPALWDFDVYIERSLPFERYLNSTSLAERKPIVNVWYNDSTYEAAASNISERQRATGIFNVDCYGAAVAADTVDGHQPADEAAALEAQRVMRLVRNILMSSSNTYFQLQGMVGQRWIQSQNMFQPQLDTKAVCQVIAGRLAVRVGFNEFSPQYVPETLEYVAIQIVKSADSSIAILNADYEY